MNIYELAKDPEIAKLIALLYEGYLMPYDELLKEMNVKPQRLNSLLEATDGLWDTPVQYTYRLTERGEVAYGIIKTRNIKINKPEPITEKKKEKKKKKKKDSASIVGKIKKKLRRSS